MLHIKKTTAVIIGILSLCLCSLVSYVSWAAGGVRGMDTAFLVVMPTMQADKLKKQATIYPTIRPEPTATEFVPCYAGPYDVATVTRIIDGDTIEVAVNGTTVERVRYIGIDTPERGEPGYAEATDYNASLVDNRLVSLYTDVNDRDKYGRLLRYVVLTDGTLVNFKLVYDGYAIPAEYPPDTSCAEVFAQAQYFGTPMPFGEPVQVQSQAQATPTYYYPTPEPRDHRDPSEHQ